MKLKPKMSLTEADLAEAEITRMFGMVGASLRNTFRKFWYKQDGKPRNKAELQAEADKLGTFAADGMTYHGVFQAALYQISPWSAENPDGWKPLTPTHDYTKNADGTITIGDPIQVA